MVDKNPTNSQVSRTRSKASQRTYVRQDLWDAIVDYWSGTRYIWDEAQGVARRALPDEPLPTFPTLTKRLAEEWREDFLRSSVDELLDKDQKVLSAWKVHKFRTNLLLDNVRQSWNKDLTRRVKRRVDEFFVSLQGTIIPSTAASGGPTEPDDVAAGDLQDLKYTEQIIAARDAGNFFGVGQLLVRSLTDANSQFQQTIFARIVASWASTQGPLFEPDSVADLTARVETFAEEPLATSFINSLYQFKRLSLQTPEGAGDLAYKLRVPIVQVYDLDDRRSPMDTCNAALAKLETKLTEFEGAVQRFSRTTPATAKVAAIEITKLSHALQPLLVTSERSFLRDLEPLVGPAFKKLCEAYERNDDVEVIRRAPELIENAKNHLPVPGDARSLSGLWNGLVAPIVTHISTLVESALTRGEVALAPALTLRNSGTKADLRDAKKNVSLSFTLHNAGRVTHMMSRCSARSVLTCRESRSLNPPAPSISRLALSGFFVCV
jgi:hypothetical protein